MRCKIFAIGKIRTGTKSQQNRHFKNTNAKNGGYYLKNLPFIIKVSDSTKNEFASIIIELRFNLLKASKIKSSENFPFDRSKSYEMIFELLEHDLIEKLRLVNFLLFAKLVNHYWLST